MVTAPWVGIDSALADEEKKPRKPPAEETTEEAERRADGSKRRSDGKKDSGGARKGEDGDSGKKQDAGDTRTKDDGNGKGGEKRGTGSSEKPGSSGEAGSSGETGSSEAPGSSGEKAAPKPATPAPAETPRSPAVEASVFSAIAAEFQRGDAAALSKRLPARGRISLGLCDVAAGSYRAEQARSLLEKYFRERTFTSVTVKGVQDRVGTCDAVFVRAADRRRVTTTLVLTLGQEDGRWVIVGVRDGGSAK